jgi:DNA-binding response OmpR family regulator
MTVAPLILAVDHNRRNLELLSEVFSKAGYETVSASTLEELSQALADPQTVRLALVDLAGFDRGIWDYCERLQERKIPFLVVSPKLSSQIQKESLAHGASGFVVKPLVIRELLALVQTLLE